MESFLAMCGTIALIGITLNVLGFLIPNPENQDNKNDSTNEEKE